MRRSRASVEGISLPAVFAPGTRDLTAAAGTLPHGEGAAENAFAAAADDGSEEPEEDWVDVDRSF
ncbi:hypothetical protein GCM10010339_18240 [Streptomyces alanosinicus]|uniref:Uncharacterized protein n=1 Tax=Streptomyces alanosinicus TaxID=68171 RepID=A0A918YFF4_9ACTN|nr:hypothetical protein GCM10010339_18240 [Streptomyces alanosinicus]